MRSLLVAAFAGGFYLTFKLLEPKMAARKKLLVASLGIVLPLASVFALTYRLRHAPVFHPLMAVRTLPAGTVIQDADLTSPPVYISCEVVMNDPACPDPEHQRLPDEMVEDRSRVVGHTVKWQIEAGEDIKLYKIDLPGASIIPPPRPHPTESNLKP